MSDVIKDGLAWLTGQLRDRVSQVVTYARGSDSVDVPAVIEMQMLKIDDGMGGIRIEYTDLEACIPTANLSFDGLTPVEPRRGDLIYRTMPYDVQVFEIMPLDNNADWRWSDPVGQTMRRVRAKHIDTEQFS